MLEILILYILHKYDCTIYKIQKNIMDMFFVLSCPSLGAINPALKRLESLNCVEFTTNMSEGGRCSKIYKITPFGLKYLKETVSVFDFKNQAHLLNNTKICISVSDILSKDEKEKFKMSAVAKLKILKIDIENKLKDPYILYSTEQKELFEAMKKEIDTLVDLLK